MALDNTQKQNPDRVSIASSRPGLWSHLSKGLLGPSERRRAIPICRFLVENLTLMTRSRYFTAVVGSRLPRPLLDAPDAR
jgi:hypothetical protein